MNLKHSLVALAVAGALAVTAGAGAEDADLRQQLTEARQQGSVWTAIAVNRNLSPFRIDVDVSGDTAILTGTVDSEVDRELAEQVAREVDGINQVDNRLEVDQQSGRGDERDRGLGGRVDDATLTATIKSKLLWNRRTQGLDIKVRSENGVVTLSGQVDSEETRELAGRIAEDTDQAREIRNQLNVSDMAGSDFTGTAQNAAHSAGDALSDAWVTSKVKSSLLFSRNLSGTSISVDTQGGRVRLAGTVESDAEREQVIRTAEDIRGVTEVNAQDLTVRD
ncbi:BON domain-containing protein [Halopseudomonas nanhaiensis]|uniref:BON domain-containing protein n=1 Tax=Halopseudomonas nanhaiensis TaxID=2830842 RepID=UPI001CBA726D|nr:BON domain-containing protein [Halopseudomonas nanhaiensis]